MRVKSSPLSFSSSPRATSRWPLAFAALLVLATLSALPPGLAAQRGYSVPNPEALQRATEQGEGGKLEWKEYDPKAKAHRCVTCNGKKTTVCLFCARIGKFFDAEKCPECKNPPTNDLEKPNKSPCRTCAGTGHLPDYLEQLPCPGCANAGLVACPRCVGQGGYGAGPDTDALVKCTICKGTGHFPCRVCDGDRLVAPAKLKPSFAEASAKDLKKASEALEEAATGLGELATTSDARKDSKVWSGKELRPAFRYFPPIRAAVTQAADLAKSHAKAGRAQGQESMVADAFDTRRKNIETYIAYQRRMIELALARAEHNESLDD
jgi:hypothetical protein